jgi:hypothetical protein
MRLDAVVVGGGQAGMAFPGPAGAYPARAEGGDFEVGTADERYRARQVVVATAYLADRIAGRRQATAAADSG